jgi:hypothetical protein
MMVIKNAGAIGMDFIIGNGLKIVVLDSNDTGGFWPVTR